MKNYVHDGCSVEATAVGAVTSGDFIKVGSRYGVAVSSVANGETYTHQRVGVFKLPKKAATAFTEGQLAYWDSGAGEVTDIPNAGANDLIGSATETGGVLAAATEMEVSLDAHAIV